MFPFLICTVEEQLEVLQYENYDIQSIKTPVDVNQLERLLKLSEYNVDEMKFLCASFKHGFDLGYAGPEHIAQQAPNLKLRVGNKTVLWNKVMKEVKLGRYAGPYANSPPFKHFIQSPIGLVPKDNGQHVRLIFHLSYPRDSRKGYAVNACTPKDLCTVRYPEFCQAIQMCLSEGAGCHVCKSDMSSAFRILGLSKSSWKFLVMKAQSPVDKNWYFFVDKCLPFGAAISCAHFQRVSNAIAHLFCHRTGKGTVNYLDDFLFVALLKWLCNQQLQVFLDVCAQIKFPVYRENLLGHDCHYISRLSD